MLPDVSGIDRTFAYEVPAELAGIIRVGCIVRVVLNGRRVRGWVVAEEAGSRPGIDLRPVSELVSLGPAAGGRRARPMGGLALRGRLRPLLVAASPPRSVRSLPAAPSGAAGEPATPARAIWGAGPLERGDRRGHHPGPLVPSPCCASRRRRRGWRSWRRPSRRGRQRGDLLVLAASRHDALTLASRLERSGHAVALHPEAWAEAAAGGRIVVGTRSAVLAPSASCAASSSSTPTPTPTRKNVSPTWEAGVLADERARRAGAPCLLVSACPSVEMLAGRRLVTLSRARSAPGGRRSR